MSGGLCLKLVSARNGFVELPVYSDIRVISLELFQEDVGVLLIGTVGGYQDHDVVAIGVGEEPHLLLGYSPLKTKPAFISRFCYA